MSVSWKFGSLRLAGAGTDCEDQVRSGIVPRWRRALHRLGREGELRCTRVRQSAKGEEKASSETLFFARPSNVVERVHVPGRRFAGQLLADLAPQ